MIYDYKDSEYYKAVNELYSNEFSAAFNTSYIMKLSTCNEFCNGTALSQMELTGCCRFNNSSNAGVLPIGFQVQLPVFRSLKVACYDLYLRDIAATTITYNNANYKRYLPIERNVNYLTGLDTIDPSVMSSRKNNVVAYFVIGKEKYTGWYLYNYHSSGGGSVS